MHEVLDAICPTAHCARFVLNLELGPQFLPTLYLYPTTCVSLRAGGATNWLFVACVSVDFCGLSMFVLASVFSTVINTTLFILQFLCFGLSIWRVNGVFFFFVLVFCSAREYVGFFFLCSTLKFYTTTISGDPRKMRIEVELSVGTWCVQLYIK